MRTSLFLLGKFSAFLLNESSTSFTSHSGSLSLRSGNERVIYDSRIAAGVNAKQEIVDAVYVTKCRCSGVVMCSYLEVLPSHYQQLLSSVLSQLTRA